MNQRTRWSRSPVELPLYFTPFPERFPQWRVTAVVKGQGDWGIRWDVFSRPEQVREAIST